MIQLHMDRISELPECIIHKILSFLPRTKDAAQTSVLSKSWKRALSSYPVLIFHEKDFGAEKEKFYSFVDGSLVKFCSSNNLLRIQKIRLYIMSLVDSQLSSFIDKWIRLAAKANVKELVLSIRKREGCDGLQLPQSIFDAQSLTVLELSGGINIRDHPQLSINLHSLQRLSLYNLHVDDPMIQKLFCSCPLLEDFYLMYCSGFRSICVSGLFKLKNFALWYSSAEHRVIKVDIEAPVSVQTLYINCEAGRSNCILEVAAARDLTSIALWGCTITDQFFYDFNSKFPCLEELSISPSCRMPERVKISSHRLEKLFLYRGSNRQEIEIDTPNLLSFYYEGEKLPISITAPCQWEVRLEVEERVYFNPRWFLELKEFLSNSTQIEYLCIGISPREVKIKRSLEKLREVLLPLQCELKLLHLRHHLSTSSCVALLDGLVWICRPKALCLHLKEPEKFISFLYKKLRHIQEGCSCGFIKCWLHYLQDLEITTDTGMVHKISLQTNDLFNDLLTLPPGKKFHLYFKW